jgi:hypothetical protein
VSKDQSESLVKNLNLYRLRADVTITYVNTPVNALFSHTECEIPLIDPRSKITTLGHYYGRLYEEIDNNCNLDQWDIFSYNLCIADFGRSFQADKFYALDINLDQLGGVDFHKGCYVGQELTSRMKRRGQIKNRLCTLKTAHGAEVGAEISQNDHVIGTVVAQSGGIGLGLIRIDRYDPLYDARSNDTPLTLCWQSWQLPLSADQKV